MQHFPKVLAENMYGSAKLTQRNDVGKITLEGKYEKYMVSLIKIKQIVVVLIISESEPLWSDFSCHKQKNELKLASEEVWKAE